MDILQQAHVEIYESDRYCCSCGGGGSHSGLGWLMEDLYVSGRRGKNIGRITVGIQGLATPCVGSGRI